jgi:hypothetical protein
LILQKTRDEQCSSQKGSELEVGEKVSFVLPLLFIGKRVYSQKINQKEIQIISFQLL